MSDHPNISPENLIRANDWEERLAVYLDACAERPFAWGEHDCALFAAGALRAMCGLDPAAELRGTYDTKTGAARVLRELGAANGHVGTLIGTAGHWLGEPKPPALAKRGDIVMRGRTALGVCVGTWSYFVGDAGGAAGLVWLPTSTCSRAWTVRFEAAR